MTKLKLDDQWYDQALPFPEVIVLMNEHQMFRAGKGTWEKRSKMPGFPIHRPNGPRGSRFAIGREVYEYLRSRCTDSAPAQTTQP